MPSPNKIREVEYPILWYSLWTANNRFNPGYSEVDDYLFPKTQGDIFAARFDADGVDRFAIGLHNPTGNEVSSAGATPEDERGRDSGRMPVPQWESVPTWRQNGFALFARAADGAGMRWGIYGRQGKQQWNDPNHPTPSGDLLDPQDIWQTTSDVEGREVLPYGLDPDDPKSLTFITKCIDPFWRLGGRVFGADNMSGSSEYNETNGNVLGRDVAVSYQTYLLERGLGHYIEAFTRDEVLSGQPWDAEYLQYDQQALWDYITSSSRAILRIPMAFGEEKKLWGNHTLRNDINTTGDVNTALAGSTGMTVQAFVDLMDSYGYIWDVDDSGNSGGEEAEAMVAALHNRSHIERAWVSPSNQIRIWVYPNAADWGSHSFSSSGFEVRVNESSRTITDFGSDTVLADGRIERTITFDGAAISDSDVVDLTIPVGAWTAQTGQQSRACYQRACIYRSAYAWPDVEFQYRVGSGAWTTAENGDTIDVGNLAEGTETVRMRAKLSLDSPQSLNYVATRVGGQQIDISHFSAFTGSGTSAGTITAGGNKVVTTTITRGHSLKGNSLVMETDHPVWKHFVLYLTDSQVGALRVSEGTKRTDLRLQPWNLEVREDGYTITEDMDLPQTHRLLLTNAGTNTLTFSAPTHDEHINLDVDLDGVTLEREESIEVVATLTALGAGSIQFNHNGSNDMFTINFSDTEDTTSRTARPPFRLTRRRRSINLRRPYFNVEDLETLATEGEV